MPAATQQQVIAEVNLAVTRSNFTVRAALKCLGVSPRNYYRWCRAENNEPRDNKSRGPAPVYAALPEERQAVIDFALTHPEIRHRELAWRMIDEDVVALGASTIYRILREELLMNLRPGRQKRYRDQVEKPTAPDQVWATDLMYIKLGEQNYYLTIFVDEYSRYIVHWELLARMDGNTMSASAQAALQTLPTDNFGKLLIQPDIRTDNGSGYISGEFAQVMSVHGLTHRRIRPHCPEENGVVERLNRTVRETLEEYEVNSRQEAEIALGKIIEHYNNVRLHSSLGYLPPAVYYRGNPEQRLAQRREKLREARQRRKEANLKRWQTRQEPADQPVT